jgi:hypothetical protein
MYVHISVPFLAPITITTATEHSSGVIPDPTTTLSAPPNETITPLPPQTNYDHPPKK